MEHILIRKAELKDLETLQGFEQGIINTERPFDPTLKPGAINYYDIEKMIGAADVELLVAELDSKIIASGYARIENAKPYINHRQYAYLGFMYVVPEQRGKGINKMIINGLSEWARAQQIYELRLDVYQPNVSAIRAYETAGFTKYMVNMRMGIE